ncbi:MAG: TIGR01212 family radical SAM protein [Bacteroidota bacterium]
MINHHWGHNRRFNAFSNYFKQKFGRRVQKLSIDAGFTCPNRDGSRGTGGCSFCNNDAFNPNYCIPEKSITRQLEEGIEFHQKRYENAGDYIAYFQAYSNTYDQLENLKKKYEEALAHPRVIGLVIGTRPDCLDEGIFQYLKEINKTHYLFLENGIESCYDQTLKQINRGHTFDETRKAILTAHEHNITTGAHMIIGLPGEKKAEILDEADILSRLPIHSVKFHQLQIIKNTAIEKLYLQKPELFEQFTLEEYISFITDFIERLNPQIKIERIAGEAPPQFLALKQGWGLRNDQILNLFEKELARRDSWQGKYYNH